MIFRFTKKAQKSLKFPRLPDVPASENLFDEWFVHVFHSASRHKYFMTTNAASLFSVIIYGRGVVDETVFYTDTFRDMRELLKKNDCEFFFHRFIAPHTGRITVSNTNNRSVLGSMNDLVEQALVAIDYKDMVPFAASEYVNQTPMSALGMADPADFIKNIKL